MLRAWWTVGLCVGMGSLLGCGSDTRGSLINDTSKHISVVASTVTGIKGAIADFAKKKEAGKEEDAKKDLDEATEQAKKLEAAGKELQQAMTRTAAIAAATPDEKKTFVEKNQGPIDASRRDLVEAHREMKKVVGEANKKYEDSMRPFMQALTKAESEFAAIVRKK